MKKMVLALTTVAAFTGSALAADLPAAPVYTKAPMMAPVANWTGFYIFGGAGGGVWDADNFSINAAGNATTISQRQGGDGWFGTVGAGYDWQFNTSWVAGIFADGQFGSLRGNITDPINGLTGGVKLQDTWAAGVRLGYLVAPNVFSYVNAGFTESFWSGASLGPVTGTGATVNTSSFNSNGWFVGGGVENNLNIFGITAPGWFMKTEYRAAYFNRATLAESNIATGALTGNSTSFHPLVQTISTSLVYRFNWGGPVVAKY